MAELDRAAICARIAQSRTEAGLTQPELGEALEPPVHWRTVQTWESVKRPRVPWDRLDQIARITGRTKEWLLHGDESVEVGALQQIRDLREELLRRDQELNERLEAIAELQRELARRLPTDVPR